MELLNILFTLLPDELMVILNYSRRDVFKGNVFSGNDRLLPSLTSNLFLSKQLKKGFLSSSPMQLLKKLECFPG